MVNGSVCKYSNHDNGLPFIDGVGSDGGGGDSAANCSFPLVSKSSIEVRNLLEISDAMDVAALRSKWRPPKQPNRLGPWWDDTAKSPTRKQPRIAGNGKKHVAKFSLSKRNYSTGVLCSSPLLGGTEDKFVFDRSGQSPRRQSTGKTRNLMVDPYFRTKSHSNTSGTGLSSRTTKSTRTDHPNHRDSPRPVGGIDVLYQTPSLPTLISLQSGPNKDLNRTFSLGKVEFQGIKGAFRLRFPTCSLSTNINSQNNDDNDNNADNTNTTATINNNNNNHHHIDNNNYRQVKSAGKAEADEGPLAAKRQTTAPENVVRSHTIQESDANRNSNRVGISTKSRSPRPKQELPSLEPKPLDAERSPSASREEGTVVNTVFTNDGAYDNNNNDDNDHNATNITNTDIDNGRTSSLGFVPASPFQHGKRLANNNSAAAVTAEAQLCPRALGPAVECDLLEQPITSPPENPKILKILSQRKPSPPFCEYQDISLHMKHYRMFHTVRFTGQFSPANQQFQHQDVKPVQWEEVFPHRPLSVNTTAAVPVFRLKLEDFSSESKTDLATGAQDALEVPCVTAGESEKGEDQENELLPEEIDDLSTTRNISSRKIAPNFKNKNLKIDLSPTVTPVLKVGFKRNKNSKRFDVSLEERGPTGNPGNGEGENMHLISMSVDSYTKQDLHKDEPITVKAEYLEENNVFNCEKSPSPPLKQQKRRRKGRALSKYVMLESHVPDDKAIQNNVFSSTLHPDGFPNDFGSPALKGNCSNTEVDRTPSRAFLSYKDFARRSKSNKMPKDNRTYSPGSQTHTELSYASFIREHQRDRLRMTYPHRYGPSSQRPVSDTEEFPVNWRKIIIDEEILKRSVNDKIRDRPYPASDNFIRFMIKHEEYRQSQGYLGSRGNAAHESRDSRLSEEEKVHQANLLHDHNDTGSIVTTYDCNTFGPEANGVIENGDKENAEKTDHKELNKSVLVAKGLWQPKLSCLSARTRAANRRESYRDDLVSSPFVKPIGPRQSAFVIAVPPPNVGFDDRGFVLPVQDFVHLAMKGNDKTSFSSLSQSINSSSSKSKVGLSPNMTIRSCSGRRTMDDGLVRVVSFASPVNQFIFAKRITGYSAQGRGASVSDGTSATDGGEGYTSRAFSQHSKSTGNYRLRLRDFGIHRHGSRHAQTHGCNNNDDDDENNRGDHLQIKDDQLILQNNMDKNSNDSILGTTESKKEKGDVDEVKDNFSKEKIMDVYIDDMESNNTKEGLHNMCDDNDDITGEKMDLDGTKRTSEYGGLFRQWSQHNRPKSKAGSSDETERERATSSLRQHIVKLAELRSSSQASNCDTLTELIRTDSRIKFPRKTTHEEMIAKVKSSAPSLTRKERCLDQPSKTPLEYSEIQSILSTDQSQEVNPSHQFRQTITVEADGIDGIISGPGQTLGKETHLLSSFQQKCQLLRQKRATTLSKKSILKSGVVLHKDSEAVARRQIQSQGPSVSRKPQEPERHQLMFTKVSKGSCVKRDTTDPTLRPKTVRFECDGLEYKIVDRTADS